MPAYLYGDIEVTDREGYEEYRQKAPPIVAAYGGKYVVRGASADVLEGDVKPARQVILEFPDMDSLLAFYNSPEYRPLKELRQRCSVGYVLAMPSA